LVVIASGSATASTGEIILTSASGAIIVASTAWTYLEPPALVEVYPTSGQVGTVATISGTGMLSGASSVVKVEFAGVEVLNIIAQSDTSIVVEVAANSDGREETGAIKLTTSSGATVTGGVEFSYIDEGSISSVSPNQGRVGTSLTISGQDLCGGGDEVVRIQLAGFDAVLDDVSACVSDPRPPSLS
jgi:hypothetical protein